MVLPREGEVAVIDVGSNSIRLVAYRIDGRAMTPFLNEKVMAGLGRGLGKTGRLNENGVREAIEALARFRVVLQSLEIKDVSVVATAAVRSASDGEAFVTNVLRRCGFRLRVLSGVEEARFSALGVLAGAPEARGMVGDLGGSSLELIPISPDGPGRGETHALGPLALGDTPFDAERVAAAADAALEQQRSEGGVFFAVGGAWRALGRIDMALRSHPIHVLHHHEMSPEDVAGVVQFLRRARKQGLEKTLERVDETAAKRADAMPYAATVLERVLAWGKFERVVLSAFGLREGLLFERMADPVRRVHPLIASAAAFGAPGRRARAFGAALAAWSAPVREAAPTAFTPAQDTLLWDAAALLSDLGAALHPDQRATLMFDLIVRAPLAGVSHPERAFLAGAIHHRYTKKAPAGQPAFDALLTPGQRHTAAILGATLRLGADLSGRGPRLLQALPLRVVKAQPVIDGSADVRAALSSAIARRLDPLAQLLAAPPAVPRA